MSKPNCSFPAVTTAAFSELLDIADDALRDLLEAHADDPCGRCGVALREHTVRVPAHDFIGEEDLQ